MTKAQNYAPLSAAKKNNHQQEEQDRAATLVEEARRREVSRAVREYVAASEARRREEHGAGPPLEELIRRKKVCCCVYTALSLKRGVGRDGARYLTLVSSLVLARSVVCMYQIGNIGNPIRSVLLHVHHQIKANVSFIRRLE